MVARIFKPARTAMQSGTRNTKEWRLEFVSSAAPGVEPLMGWTSSADTTRQVKLDFPTKEDAIRYAQRNAIPFEVEGEKTANEKKIAYADNF
ncbi:MAG: ETC complex I subunit, partial [Pseudomonadota bacterium]